MVKFLSLGGGLEELQGEEAIRASNQDEKQRAEFLALFLHERQCQTTELTKDLLLIKAMVSISSRYGNGTISAMVDLLRLRRGSHRSQTNPGLPPGC